ncbi:helix-turn-helix domain-containing protein [Nocardia arthritidis]|uniref:Helix-turn-helix domain-containing protein n=1 Tax=Nocardia arthritidis TaxID=228602 RepID=A0A6G9Y6I6_9NOCA|nr:helix-turn-helix domain-containing protein [Nocardia arthritidis]
MGFFLRLCAGCMGNRGVASTRGGAVVSCSLSADHRGRRVMAVVEEIGSTIPKRQLGRYLRDGREECGFTLGQAARMIARSPSTLQRIETGQVVKLNLDDIDALCRLYDFSPEKTAAMKGLAGEANKDSWWVEYSDLIPSMLDIFIGLESAAQSLIPMNRSWSRACFKYRRMRVRCFVLFIQRTFRMTTLVGSGCGCVDRVWSPGSIGQPSMRFCFVSRCCSL